MDAWHYRLAAVWKYYDKDNVPLEWYLTVALLRVFACLILWIFFSRSRAIARCACDISAY
jgi:hypothetical protein